MSNVFVTSDSHWDHDNIIKYSNRPYTNTDEMNEALINNWNYRVKPNDKIYHLGDFAFGKGLKHPEKFFNRLNGKKYLIKGNHDHEKTLALPWDSINELLEISVGKQRIVLCHYAMRVWHHSYRDTWQLYGHSHVTLPETDSMSCDVGVDGWNYSPVSFETIREKMKWKKENPDYFSKIFSNSDSGEINKNSIFISNEIRKVNSIFY